MKGIIDMLKGVASKIDKVIDTMDEKEFKRIKK